MVSNGENGEIGTCEHNGNCVARGGDRPLCTHVWTSPPSSSLFSPAAFHLSSVRSAPPQPDRPDALPREKQDGPLLMTSRRQRLAGDGLVACLSLCGSVCDFVGDDTGQRATVTPRLLHCS